jgi:hypothetical protein
MLSHAHLQVLCCLRNTHVSPSTYLHPCLRRREQGEADLKTNFVSDKPSSWYAELYQRDQLTGGHVIMLGSDDASRWGLGFRLNLSAQALCVR